MTTPDPNRLFLVLLYVTLLFTRAPSHHLLLLLLSPTRPSVRSATKRRRILRAHPASHPSAARNPPYAIPTQASIVLIRLTSNCFSSSILSAGNKRLSGEEDLSTRVIGANEFNKQVAPQPKASERAGEKATMGKRIDVYTSPVSSDNLLIGFPVSCSCSLNVKYRLLHYVHNCFS